MAIILQYRIGLIWSQDKVRNHRRLSTKLHLYY